MENFRRQYAWLGPELLAEIEQTGSIQHIPAQTELLREGQYVKVIPIVLDGLIKVLTRSEERELLLYYIQPGESCIMSFSASLKNEPSRIIATTEEDTIAMLLPSDAVAKWIRQYPNLNALFYQQFNLRYAELLDTVNHLLFGSLEQRLREYLRQKTQVTGTHILKLTHRQIAQELGTAREVISRLLKKLEKDGAVLQLPDSIDVHL